MKLRISHGAGETCNFQRCLGFVMKLENLHEISITSPFSGESPLPKVDATTSKSASCSIDDIS